MDPVTLIVTALVTGLAESAREGVKDGYHALTQMIRRKLQAGGAKEQVLEKAGSDPEAAKQIEDELVKAGAERDADIIEAAQRLMKVIDPAGSQSGKYQIKAGKIGIIGDHAQVDNMNF